MWKICQKSKLKHIIIQTSIHYVVQRQNDSWNRPLWLLLFLQICGLLIFGLCMGSLTFCLTFMHRSTRQQKQTETNNGKQGSLKATCSFLHSLESQCSKKKKRLQAPPPDTPTLPTICCMETGNDKYSESWSATHMGCWTLTGNILQMMFKSLDMSYTRHTCMQCFRF